MPAVLRILDANANRAREALRVMEDAVRFLLDDAGLAEPIKQLRHDLAQALAGIPNLQAHRDTPGDVGTTITTPAEQSRAGVADVALAAGKRLSEALRSIEEFAKTLPTDQAGVASAVEQLRYRGYEIEQQLNAALSSTRAKQWRVCLLLTESLCKLPWLDVLDQALDAGVDCVQLREKDLEASELLDRAATVVERCHQANSTAIINDRPDIAFASGADGVHLGQTDLPVAAVRKLVGHQLLVGVSTSNLDQARAAKAAGADYVGVGPMFPTTTKHKPVLAGPAYLREYLADERVQRMPHLAIGGITPDNLPKLMDAGVQGIAVSSVICAAEQPGKVALRLLQEWD
ncbi:thiamine phosphate synthase [Algisphaera agarilytica]|uniref:Thiamine-phosphate synthase n=1 Tax=Algisphaera agarilytica TaxID=1385975 RepID=A0A7X0LKI7_9BACT|nr:thiamine phosphate synthase [Algisphaera agarilytica]MBB6430470.1 thiamine-phosphate pyrophosphorylase [Algisphaera agarilytica]